MAEGRYRVLAIATHPVQYMSANYRAMADHPRLDFQVAYCSLRGAVAGHDPGFGATVKWDVPLMDGYRWVEVPNKGDGGESFWGFWNPGLWKIVRKGNFDAILCYTGYISATFWICVFAAKLSGAAFLFGTDAVTLTPRDGRTWKRTFKRLAWPILFRIADQAIVPSSGSQNLMRSLGLPANRVTLTPYVVDNDWWIAQSARVDRTAVRASWGAGAADMVVLFCAKLQPWKRPLDLLRAFAKADLPQALLVFAGEGPLRTELEREASELGVAERVRFLGFVNQSQLPSVYKAADLMVLPSEYEPFAVVVNEAMLCGCPVAVSDRVGAAEDLVAPVSRNFIFPQGDIETLASLLRNVSSNRVMLESFGQAARHRMDTWSLRENVAATLAAIEKGVSRVRSNKAGESRTPTAKSSVATERHP